MFRLGHQMTIILFYYVYFFSLHVSQNFVSNWSTWLLIEKIDKVRKRKKLGQIELVDNSKVLNDKMIFKEI